MATPTANFTHNTSGTFGGCEISSNNVKTPLSWFLNESLVASMKAMEAVENGSTTTAEADVCVKDNCGVSTAVSRLCAPHFQCYDYLTPLGNNTSGTQLSHQYNNNPKLYQVPEADDTRYVSPTPHIAWETDWTTSKYSPNASTLLAFFIIGVILMVAMLPLLLMDGELFCLWFVMLFFSVLLWSLCLSFLPMKESSTTAVATPPVHFTHNPFANTEFDGVHVFTGSDGRDTQVDLHLYLYQAVEWRFDVCSKLLFLPRLEQIHSSLRVAGSSSPHWVNIVDDCVIQVLTDAAVNGTASITIDQSVSGGAACFQGQNCRSCCDSVARMGTWESANTPSVCQAVSFFDFFLQQNTVAGTLQTLAFTILGLIMAYLASIPNPHGVTRVQRVLGLILFPAWMICVVAQYILVAISLSSFVCAAASMSYHFQHLLRGIGNGYTLFNTFAIMAGGFQPFVLSCLKILSLYTALMAAGVRIWNNPKAAESASHQDEHLPREKVEEMALELFDSTKGGSISDSALQFVEYTTTLHALWPGFCALVFSFSFSIVMSIPFVGSCLVIVVIGGASCYALHLVRQKTERWLEREQGQRQQEANKDQPVSSSNLEAELGCDEAVIAVKDEAVIAAKDEAVHPLTLSDDGVLRIVARKTLTVDNTTSTTDDRHTHGLGIQIDAALAVTFVGEGGQAIAAGVEVGDVITNMGGVDFTSGKTDADAMAALNAAKAESSDLVVEFNGGAPAPKKKQIAGFDRDKAVSELKEGVGDAAEEAKLESEVARQESAAKLESEVQRNQVKRTTVQKYKRQAVSYFSNATAAFDENDDGESGGALTEQALSFFGRAFLVSTLVTFGTLLALRIYADKSVADLQNDDYNLFIRQVYSFQFQKARITMPLFDWDVMHCVKVLRDFFFEGFDLHELSLSWGPDDFLGLGRAMQTCNFLMGAIRIGLTIVGGALSLGEYFLKQNVTVAAAAAADLNPPLVRKRFAWLVAQDKRKKEIVKLKKKRQEAETKRLEDERKEEEKRQKELEKLEKEAEEHEDSFL
jgi:hypothetical protein